ncbi:MAG: pyridoxamine 5'-phosphate oxidase [Gammaproteobacteria bacterium]|nr:pyridoxamine 5'-phosphate oxidase [Gammaproteobacteria bacterium]NNM01883.1 pyridoxamine 5'-phosphate oxidase [Gammaproteobacteria bacterium]
MSSPSSLSDTVDPIALAQQWMADAAASESGEPTAVALATATPAGRPSVRMVLIRGVDENGFVFYTNLRSRKGDELEANPFAALCFHWKSLDRQLRIEGPVRLIDEATADAYFASRERGSQIGAWASRQSQPISAHGELEQRVNDFNAQYEGRDVPRPPFWSGYVLQPETIEFWQIGESRLHDRSLYQRSGAQWNVNKLHP